MLIRFVVNNFRSFSEEREFNMLAGSFKTHKHHVYKVGKLDLLKAAAIYGTNGAGKSNLIKAVEFLQEVVRLGRLEEPVESKKFKLNEANLTKPMSFEIELSLGKKFYSYGVSFQNTSVVEEWLYELGITIDDKLIFERKQGHSGKPVIKIADKYLKTDKDRLLKELMEERLLKQEELLLGKGDELNVIEIREVRDAIEDGIFIIHPGSKFLGLVEKIVVSEKFKEFANSSLKAFQTGVIGLATENINLDKFFGEEATEVKELIKRRADVVDGFALPWGGSEIYVSKRNEQYIVTKILTEHTREDGKSVGFEVSEESDGTKRLLDFIPALDYVVKKDVTFFIDEIDQSLHTTLLQAIVSKIMSETETKGQLVFTTHESNLLTSEIFRQDEIWFMEKNLETNASEIYSLSEFKPRYDLDFRKGYLKGRFGAIPFTGDLENVNW